MASSVVISPTCSLFIEDFKDEMAPGPYLLKNYSCRNCKRIPATHGRKPSENGKIIKGNTLKELSSFYLLFAWLQLIIFSYFLISNVQTYDWPVMRIHNKLVCHI